METTKKQAKKSFFILLPVLVLSLAYSGYGATDGYSPKPDPEFWRFVPAAMGPNTIYMKATPAIDVNDPPVRYYFECTDHPEASSGWVSDANYTATGLTPGTTYSFRVRTCDNDGGDPNTQSRWSLTTPSATTDLDTTPPVLKLDLNYDSNNDDANTQIGFTKFIIPDGGSEVNGVIIDIEGETTSARREDPCGAWEKYDPWFGSIPGDPCWYSPRAGERIYRDFIYGIPPSGVTITLWGLGVNQDCNITMWTYDSESTGGTNRVAMWYANGTYIFDTNFIGGPASYPKYDNQPPAGWQDLYKYACHVRATADAFGRIALTSLRGPNSPETEPFAFVNAIKVEPNALTPFVPTPYAHRPVPFDGTEDVPVYTKLKWGNGDGVATHDLYLGTSWNDVNDATRAFQPPGVSIYEQDLPTGANEGYDPFDAAGFLALDTTYYWRVDENPGIYKGEVWSFTTCPNSVVDNFNKVYGPSYPDRLRDTWKDYWTQGQPRTSAEVYLATDPNRGGPPYQSMRYDFLNTYEPYYSEVRATIGTGADELNIDPNWLGMGAKALVLWFYGQADNPTTEQMYVKLTDGYNNFGTVTYGDQPDEDPNYVKDANWHEWNIDLALFDAFGVNLSDVKKITIGFGDGTPAPIDGTMYFEDIQLYTTRCVLAKRSAEFAKVDYAPFDMYGYPCGDCKVDDKELKWMYDDWLEPAQATKTGEIKIEIHIVKDSGITEEQIREQIKNANEADDPNAKFVVTSVHIYEPNTPYDANFNEKCKVNIWGLKKNPWHKRFPGLVDPNVSAQWSKVIILVPGDGNNTYIKPSTGAHELNHFLGLDHNDVNNNPITDPNNKMYPDNDQDANGVLKSCHRKGTKLEEWQRKKISEGAKKCQKASDAVLGGYGDETYDNVGDVNFEYIDLNWMQGWIEWIQDTYVLHLTAQVDLLSFENYSEIGFYIESDSNQSTGQPPEGLDYYVALQPSSNQIKFERYDTYWIPLDTSGISFEFTYINPDVNVPPIPSGVKFESPLTLLQRRAGDVISYRAAAQNYVEMDVSPNTGLLSIAFPPPLIPPDLDSDGTVNFKDFALSANRWLEEQMFPR